MEAANSTEKKYSLEQEGVYSFDLINQDISGRIVKLGHVLDQILLTHCYPREVNLFLAELIALTALLHGSFKIEGLLTLQIKGQGPLQLVVCDITHQGHLRAYASFDLAALEEINTLQESKNFSLKELVGEGHLALIFDPENLPERYQGIVELRGDSLSQSLEHYFKQSMQSQAILKVIIKEPEIVSKESDKIAGWQSSAILLQSLPSSSLAHEEDWAYAQVLINTITDEEVSLDEKELLYKLFHERGVRVLGKNPLKAQCRCSKEKVENIFKQLSQEHCKEKKEVVCEFCGKKYYV